MEFQFHPLHLFLLHHHHLFFHPFHLLAGEPELVCSQGRKVLSRCNMKMVNFVFFSQTPVIATCHPSPQHSFRHPFDLCVSEHQRPPFIRIFRLQQTVKKGLVCLPWVSCCPCKFHQGVASGSLALFDQTASRCERDLSVRMSVEQSLEFVKFHLYLAVVHPVNEGKGSAIISNPACSSNPAGNLVDHIFSKSPPFSKYL